MKSNDTFTPSRAGFTLLELLVIIGAIALLVLTLAPALARTRNNGDGFQCLNNNRQLATAWRQWAADNNDNLLASSDITGAPNYDPKLRAIWITGNLDWNSGNPSDYDPKQDIIKSPMWPYAPNASLFKCPADRSTIVLSSSWNGHPAGTRVPRVRSYTMSQVFGLGRWLDSNLSSTSVNWRTYGKGAEIMIPAQTMLLLDEHPGSINDGAFASDCTGNQPNDPPGVAKLVDMPGNWHSGGGEFSFADNHAEIHKRRSSYLRFLANGDGYNPPLNIYLSSDPLGYLDSHWLAAM